MTAAEPAPPPVAPPTGGPPLLVLVGPPGSGKSSVGGAVAARLGVGFRDTDADVEHQAGKPIADIFVEDGEPAFRALEAAAVRRALAEHPGVLALGGGAVEDPATRAALRGHRVVYLEVTARTAAHRVGLDRSRPLLLGNVHAQLRALLERRRPLYAEVATDTVPTDRQDVDAATAAVLALLPPRPAGVRAGEGAR